MEEGKVKLKVLLMALVIGSAATACGRNAGMESGQAQPASDAATVSVSNQYMLSMSIYAVSNNNVPIKLGTVGPGLTSTFVLQPMLLRQGSVRIYAQPPGGGRVVGTGLLALQPGNVVDFEIGTDLINTTTSIR